jgi:hypothetical protein
VIRLPVRSLLALAKAGYDVNAAGTVGVLIVAALVALAGFFFGPAIALLVLAASALAAAIAAMWTSLRALVGDTKLSAEDAFAMGAPSAEEEQKRAVLRAIKDIEFEHAVGKLSDEDYRALDARYRAEAKRLLRVLDERAAPERSRAEKLALRRLEDAGLAPTGVAKTGEKIAAKKKKDKNRRNCAECGAKNEVDAAFCKACGKPIGSAKEAS